MCCLFVLCLSFWLEGRGALNEGMAKEVSLFLTVELLVEGKTWGMFEQILPCFWLPELSFAGAEIRNHVQLFDLCHASKIGPS